MTKAQTYRLGSSSMVYAPGVFRWALNGYKFNSPLDRKVSVRVLVEGWSVPRAAAIAVLSGKVPHAVEGEEVVFTI